MSIVILGSPLSPSPAQGGVAPVEPNALQARAGLAVAGVTHAGLTNFQLTLRVGGVKRGMKQNTSFRITHALGRPSTCTFQCHFPIVSGEEVTIAVDGSRRLLFGGTVDEVGRAQKDGEQTTYEVTCLDWVWLANSGTRIYERFQNLSLNTAVGKVLSYVNPNLGIRPGRIPGDLGTVSLTLDGVNLETALNDMARQLSVVWRLTPGKRIDMFREDPEVANAIELVQDTQVKMLSFKEQLNQVRTRVIGVGGGSPANGFHNAGGTSLAVRESGWYSATGGFVKLAGTSALQYTSVSAPSGPGVLTLSAPLPRDVSDNETINVYTMVEDVAAQADLASRLGGGHDGVVIYYLSDGRVNIDTITTEAQRNLDFFKNPINEANFAMGAPHFLWNQQRHWTVGRLVPTDMESEEGDLVTGTFRISDVTLEGLADVVLSDGTTYSWQINRTLRFRPGSRFGVIDLLVKS